MTEPLATKELAFSPEHRARLAPILQQLDDAQQSTFLDLCELVLMLSERIDGMLKFDHPRVKVHIKLKRLSGAERITAAREKAGYPPNPKPKAQSPKPKAVRPSQAKLPISPPPRPKRAHTSKRGARTAGGSSSASSSGRRSSRD